MYTQKDLDNVINYIVYHKLTACENESSQDYLQMVFESCEVENTDSFTEKVFKLSIKYPDLIELSKDLHCDVIRLQKIIYYQQIEDKIITGIAKIKQAEHMRKGFAKTLLRKQAELFLSGNSFAIKELLDAVERQTGEDLPKPAYLEGNIIYDFDWKKH